MNVSLSQTTAEDSKILSLIICMLFMPNKTQYADIFTVYSINLLTKTAFS